MKSFIVTKWKYLLVALIAIILIASIAITGFFLYKSDQSAKSLTKDKAEQQTQIAANEKKIEEISLALSQTEEGKKALEGINTTLEQDKSKLSSDNQQLNQQVASTQAQLTAKQQELTKINSSLAAKNAELANATKCLGLFTTVQNQYNQFKSLMIQSDSYYDQAVAAYNAGNYDSANALMDKSDNAYYQALNVFNQMDANMGKLNSGKC